MKSRDKTLTYIETYRGPDHEGRWGLKVEWFQDSHTGPMWRIQNFNMTKEAAESRWPTAIWSGAQARERPTPGDPRFVPESPKPGSHEEALQKRLYAELRRGPWTDRYKSLPVVGPKKP